jgi:hypothetical protein
MTNESDRILLADNCEHVVGIQYYPYEGAELIEGNFEDVSKSADVDVFNYCPYCGTALKVLEQAN